MLQVCVYVGHCSAERITNTLLVRFIIVDTSFVLPPCLVRRLQKDRVYYVSERLMKAAQCVEKQHLASLGTCFGKFTHSGKFRLHITCLDYLAQYAKYKMWIKPSGEMSFLYGNDVAKAHLGRITENTPKHQGVVFFSMGDIPLGFGVSAASTKDCRKLQPTAKVAFHQSDVGQYIRNEVILS